MQLQRSDHPIGNKTYRNCICVKHTTFVTSQCETRNKYRHLQLLSPNHPQSITIYLQERKLLDQVAGSQEGNVVQARRHLYFLTLMSECFCRVSLVLSYLGSLSRPITFNQYYIIMLIDQPMQRIKKSIAWMQAHFSLLAGSRGYSRFQVMCKKPQLYMPTCTTMIILLIGTGSRLY